MATQIVRLLIVFGKALVTGITGNIGSFAVGEYNIGD